MKFKKIIIYEKHKIFKNALYGQTRNESKKCPIDLFLWLVQTGTPLPLPSRILQFLIHKYFPTTTQNQLIFLDARVRVEFRCCAFFVQHLLILIIKIYIIIPTVSWVRYFLNVDSDCLFFFFQTWSIESVSFETDPGNR